MKLKKILSLALAGALTASLSTPALAGPLPEGWTPADGARTMGPWYAQAVDYVMERGLMVGTDQGFEPQGAVSAAQVLQTLYNMEGRPAAAGTAGTWYADAAAWAESAGFETATIRDLEADASRLTVGRILSWYGKNVKDIPITGTATTDSLADYASLYKTDYPYVSYCLNTGLMTGNEKGEWQPEKTLTRAEFATILLRLDALVPAQTGTFTAKAAAISKYGNVGTDLSMDTLTAAGIAVGDLLTVTVTGHEPIIIPLGTGYSNVDQGSALALPDTSNNTMALAINRGDFATTYGLGVKGEDKTYAITEGVAITVALAEKGGYLAEMEVRELDSKRTNERADYASDEVFANFRPIVMGNIAAGKLYRTSSPVNPELGRNTYADAFLKEAGVKTVVNLADSREAMEGYEGYAGTYYATLNVIPLNLGVDLYSDDAKAGLKAGLQYMAAHEGPYAFHCTEGKDRAGYFAMLLEALMGASVEEITEDYMLSFENYYHVEKGSEQWTKIAQSNIEKDLLKLTGAADAAALGKADLAKAAETYLETGLGLTAAEVQSIKTALSK